MRIKSPCHEAVGLVQRPCCSRKLSSVWGSEGISCMCNFLFSIFPKAPSVLALPEKHLLFCFHEMQFMLFWLVKLSREGVQGQLFCSLEYKEIFDNCASSSRLSTSVVVTELFTQSRFWHASTLQVPQTWRWEESCPAFLHSAILPGSYKVKAVGIGQEKCIMF